MLETYLFIIGSILFLMGSILPLMNFNQYSFPLFFIGIIFFIVGNLISEYNNVTEWILIGLGILAISFLYQSIIG